MKKIKEIIAASTRDVGVVLVEGAEPKPIGFYDATKLRTALALVDDLHWLGYIKLATLETESGVLLLVQEEQPRDDSVWLAVCPVVHEK